ncbi:hypothetical protein BRDID11002_39850 [Bradyrhizobium diazoefficiens]
MQTSTSDAVAAIGGITQTIAEMSEITAGISASIEQQGEATREIARNIQSVAAGSSEINANIGSVTSAAEATGTAATDVLTNARERGQPVRRATQRGGRLPRQGARGVSSTHQRYHQLRRHARACPGHPRSWDSHSGAMRSIELWCAIAHPENLEIPGFAPSRAPE